MKFLKFIVKVVGYLLVMPVVFAFSVVFFWNMLVPFFGSMFSMKYNDTGMGFLKKFLYFFMLPLTNFITVAKMVSRIVDEV